MVTHETTQRMRHGQLSRGLVTIDDRGVAILRPHVGQLRAWESTKRFVVVLAGTQSGKTSWGPWWLYREIQRTAKHGEQNDYLAVTATYDLFKLKFLPALRETFEHQLGIARYWAGDHVLELMDFTTGTFWAKRSSDLMWGRIILRSASSSGGLESATARAAWADEAGQDEFTIDAWEALLRRLSLTQGRVLITTTVYNMGWIKQQLYDPWKRRDPQAADIDIIQFDSTANPSFSQREFERAKASMPTWKFNMFYRGMFERPAGLIYQDFDETIHVVDPFPIPPEWPRYVGIDFGAVNTAMIWIAEDPHRNVYIAYRESLQGDRSTREHVQDALQYARNENVIVWVGGSKSETQQRMDWASMGIAVQEPRITDVESGIDRVIELFKTKRLFVFRSLHGLRDELGSYRREILSDGTITERIHNKHAYHRLDALRYVVSMLGYRPMISFV